MPYQTRMNSNGIDRRSSYDLVYEFNQLRAELDDLRTKYGALQTALNAGTAPGAAGYPNGSMALGNRLFTPT